MRLQRVMLAAITVMYLTTLGEIAFTWHLSLNVPNLMAEAPALAIWRHGYAKYIIFVPEQPHRDRSSGAFIFLSHNRRRSNS